MKPGSLTDFMLTGVATIPGALAWVDQIGLAMIAFIALLIVACLSGWREQISDVEREQAGSNSGGSVLRAPASAGHALQRYGDTPPDRSSTKSEHGPLPRSGPGRTG